MSLAKPLLKLGGTLLLKLGGTLIEVRRGRWEGRRKGRYNSTRLSDPMLGRFNKRSGGTFVCKLVYERLR